MLRLKGILVLVIYWFPVLDWASKSNEEVMSFNVALEKGLDKFINETDKNHPFVFVILKKSESLPNIVADSDEFSPIVFDKYIVSQ